jgi:hypothetical protein
LRFTAKSATITDTTPGWDVGGSPDAYVRVTVGGTSFSWPAVPDTFTPVWNSYYDFPGLTTTDISSVLIELRDDDLTGVYETIGSATVTFAADIGQEDKSYQTVFTSGHATLLFNISLQ